MKKLILGMAIGLVCSVNAQADNLEDDLFGGDEDSLISLEQTKSSDKSDLTFKADLKKATLTLESKNYKFGGGLASSLDLNYLWLDPYNKNDIETKSSLKTKLNGYLFFDARPIENLKLYGKFLFGFPFTKTLNAKGELKVPKLSPLVPEIPPIPLNSEVSGVPNFSIRELYTDFSVEDIAFFRFGKHAVKWGTGYFYSPADVINISRIDPQEPEKEREGAVSLRTHIIIPKTQHNLWLYILPPMSEDNFKPKYTAGAIKGEFVFGDWELGLGAWYKYEKAPRIITTLSGSIAGKVGIFAEGVFAWGSDYTYNNFDFSEYKIKDKPFFQFTTGLSYMNGDTKTMFAAQYYYNGFGYKDPAKLFSTAMDKIQNADKNLNNLLTPDASLINAGKTLQNLSAMPNAGQHYIALNLAQNELGTDKLGLNFFQQFAISELQGISALSFNWEIYKFISLTTGVNFSYPLSDKSFVQSSIGYTLGLQLGGGNF